MKTDRKKITIVLTSQDNKVHARIKDGIYYYYLPKEQYDEYQRQVEENNRKQNIQNAKYERETDSIIDVINNKVYERRHQEEINSALEYMEKRISKKRNIRNRPSTKKEKHKGKTKNCIRALVSTILRKIGIGTRRNGIENIITTVNEANGNERKLIDTLEENGSKVKSSKVSQRNKGEER